MNDIKKRFHFFDECRGLLIISVCIFHTLYDLTFIFYNDVGAKLYYFFGPSVPFFASLFILLCGISCFFSRNNLKRGLILLVIAAIITVGTFIIMPEYPIYFGILHLLSVSILMFIPLKKLIIKLNTTLGIVISLGLFFLTYNIENGYLGFDPISLKIPTVFYTPYLLIFGFLPFDMATADYFPLMPFSFIFLLGTFIGKLATADKLPKFFENSHIPVLSFIGRHTLIIYILHQPIIYGFCFLIFKVFM